MRKNLIGGKLNGQTLLQQIGLKLRWKLWKRAIYCDMFPCMSTFIHCCIFVQRSLFQQEQLKGLLALFACLKPICGQRWEKVNSMDLPFFTFRKTYVVLNHDEVINEFLLLGYYWLLFSWIISLLSNGLLLKLL